MWVLQHRPWGIWYPVEINGSVLGENNYIYYRGIILGLQKLFATHNEIGLACVKCLHGHDGSSLVQLPHISEKFNSIFEDDHSTKLVNTNHWRIYSTKWISTNQLKKDYSIRKFWSSVKIFLSNLRKKYFDWASGYIFTQFLFEIDFNWIYRRWLTS